MKLKVTGTGLVVAAVLAGCGGSNSSTSSHTTSAGAQSSAAQTSAAASTSTAASSATAGSASFASTGNCQQLAAMAHQYYAALSPSADGGQTSLSSVLKADQALADASPAAIHSDAELVVHGFSSYLGKLTAAGFKPGSTPSASQLAAIESAGQTLSQPSYRAAFSHVSAWINQNCKG